MATPESSPDVPPRVGRQPATSVEQLTHVALPLFIEHGFDATTIDDIASAAGIGRRTFFRYFASKNDVPWGDFDTLTDGMRAHLRSMPADLPLIDALHAAIVEFNRYPAEELPYHRQRMELLLNVPSLVAHSTLRYAAWRNAIAEFAAHRLGSEPGDLEPQTIAWASLAASLAAYEQWLRHDDADLIALLHESFAVLDRMFDRTT